MGKLMDWVLGGVMVAGAAIAGFLMVCISLLLSCAPIIIAGLVIIWIVKALGWV